MANFGQLNRTGSSLKITENQTEERHSHQQRFLSIVQIIFQTIRIQIFQCSCFDMNLVILKPTKTNKQTNKPEVSFLPFHQTGYSGTNSN